MIVNKTCRPLGPPRVPESGVRKIGIVRYVFTMFWNPSVSFLNISGNRLGISGQIGIGKTSASNY